MENNFWESKEFELMAKKYWRDNEHHREKWDRVVTKIREEYTCYDYLRKNMFSYEDMPYSDLLYKLKWPSDWDKAKFAEAEYTEGSKMKPILMRGYVIDIKKNSNGQSIITLLGLEEDVKKNDTKRILHLQNVRNSSYYHIDAYEMVENRKYKIGSLNNVRPGEAVIISLANLEPHSTREKGIVAYFTDIALDKLEYAGTIYLDEQYFFRDEKELIVEYIKKLNKEGENVGGMQVEENVQAEGCYIATAVYNSYDCPEVWTLRRFRDDFLRKTWIGDMFVKGYYKVSPVLVKYFSKETWFISFWKYILDRFVVSLQKRGYENTRYEDK